MNKVFHLLFWQAFYCYPSLFNVLTQWHLLKIIITRQVLLPYEIHHAVLIVHHF